MLSVRLRFKGCLQQAPAFGFRNKLTTPNSPASSGMGHGVGRFFRSGPHSALQSQRLVGKSEGDKVVLPRGERDGGARACPQRPHVEASQDRVIACSPV